MKQTCSWCSFDQSQDLFHIHGYTLAKCNRCGILFTKLHTQKEVLDENIQKYDETYLANYEERKDLFDERNKKRIAEIESMQQGGNLLDLGCSTGLFLSSVSKYATHKWKLYGLDMNKKSIAMAKKNLPYDFQLGTLQTVSYPDNFFDCITCFDVVEHDLQLQSSMDEMYRILKPGGLLLIQSPNYQSLMAKLCGNRWDWWALPDHVFHFTPKTIQKVLSEKHFVTKRVFTWEPKREFVLNIAGTIRETYPKIFSFNKLCAKMSQYKLTVLWMLLQPIEQVLPIGGLFVAYATKE